MASTQPPRDDITGKGSSTGSPKNAALLNGGPRIKSISGGTPNFSSKNPEMKSGFPAPNSPYGKG